MSELIKLNCRICEKEYYLHRNTKRSIANLDLCPTCEAFQTGMRGFYADEHPENGEQITMGILILSLSAICVIVLIGWALFHHFAK